MPTLLFIVLDEGGWCCPGGSLSGPVAGEGGDERGLGGWPFPTIGTMSSVTEAIKL